MILRIDDYPHGNRDTYKSKDKQYWRDTCKRALAPFEEERVPYMLGVSPLLLDNDDIWWLLKNVIVGQIVMHGFDHFWSFPQEWSKVHDTWPTGGECDNRGVDDLHEQYKLAHNVLMPFKTYNNKHFIPPFNTISQNKITMLNRTSVRFVHTMNTQYDDYKYNLYTMDKCKWLMAHWQQTYANIEVVLKERKQAPKDSVITLHWIFDSKRDDWEKDYRRLAHELATEIK